MQQVQQQMNTVSRDKEISPNRLAQKVDWEGIVLEPWEPLEEEKEVDGSRKLLT